MSINRFKFEAYCQEFPFLEELTVGHGYYQCDSIAICRIGANLLAYTPQDSFASGSLVGIAARECVSFILNDGEIAEGIVTAEGHAIHNEAHTDDESWSGETVLEAIDRLGIAGQLAYIVQVNSGYCTRDHYSEPNWRATIYKPAKDGLIRDLLWRARGKARSEVEAEAAF